MSASRLALGTAQLGFPYGVANTIGAVTRREAVAILASAWEAGVDTIDTASAYGDSEARLGSIGVERWHVVTKLPAVPDACPDAAAWIRDQVAASLHRLRRSAVHGLLLHRPLQLLEPVGAAIYDEMLALKDEGTVERIGVSIYGPDELDALATRFRFDLVQAPLNVIDRRLQTSGWLRRLHDRGTSVHARSAFLQGLLLMTPASRPAWFERWAALWGQWDAWLAAERLTAVEACVRFALSHAGVDRVVVGVEGVDQLCDLITAAAGLAPAPPASLASTDEDLINPSRWRLA